MNNRLLETYGLLKTWAGYTFLNSDQEKIAKARELWNENMQQMGLNYTVEEFLMLNNDNFKSEVYERFIDKRMRRA